MTWQQFVANWVVNDYRAEVKRHGPAPETAWPAVRVILRLWYEGLLSSQAARARLREVIR